MVVIALGVWVLMGFFGRSKAAAPVAAPVTDIVENAHPPVATPVPVSQAVIVALAAVTVQVWEENADGSYGKVLLPETALQKGESRAVPRTGPLYILASAGEMLRIDVAGKPFFPGDKGVKGNQAFELR